MKRIFAESRCLRRAGFTLIELLAVITIILLLAGLILGIAGNANYKAAQSRAQSEIQAFSTAAESYKIDNGIYPRVSHATDATNNTDDLDAHNSSGDYIDPAAAKTPTYAFTSKVLYYLLSGSGYIDSTGKLLPYDDTAKNGKIPKPTTYMAFKDSQLKYDPQATAQNATTVLYLADPFGFSYGYSTAYQADMDAINAGTNTSTTGPTHGFNPTFDLWSTAGYSQTQGKTAPTGTKPENMYTLWIKNW